MARKKPKRVVVEGYLLDFLIPTEERLSVGLDVTDVASERKYGLLRSGLEELMDEVDRKYAKRETRGRSLKGRYRLIRVGDERGERKILRFSPYPSAMANVLRNVRRLWYEALNRHSVVLARGRETAQGWVRTRCLYMVPKSKAKDLMEEVQKLNDEIEVLNGDLEKFEKSDDFARIRKWIRKMTRIDIGGYKVRIPKIELGLFEISMARGVVEEYVKDRRRETLRELLLARERG